MTDYYAPKPAEPGANPLPVVMRNPFYTPEILAAIREGVDQAPPLNDRQREIIRAAFATVPRRPDVQHRSKERPLPTTTTSAGGQE